MWLKWLPWKIIVRQAAQSQGFIDPLTVLSHLRRFSQPSEVHEPIELMRAGAIFHARGILNSRIIQHNLDWVWPFWVNRQFNPKFDTFIPRAFSLTHVNLSGRNWTAVGLPDDEHFPIVDPAGLLTPHWNGWSIDVWVASENELLAPSRLEHINQRFEFENGITIATHSRLHQLELQTKVWAQSIDGNTSCRMDASGFSERGGYLIVSIRPCNPEGVSFINSIDFDNSIKRWTINNKQHVFLDTQPDSHKLSAYMQGDVAQFFNKPLPSEYKLACDVGMVTAAAFYKLGPKEKRMIRIAVPLTDESHINRERVFSIGSAENRWQKALEGCCKLSVPDEHFNFLFEAAIRSSILHSPLDIYPGPFTYKRFWFRDAALILHALIRIGSIHLAERIIDAFLVRQTAFGYFHSQAGEWDSNGQVLWIMQLFCRAANVKPKASWIQPVIKGAGWIIHKRVSKAKDTPHHGLIPAGFSAEHLGPNDFYYWDDFWSVAGLQAAAQMLEGTNHQSQVAQFSAQADDLLNSIEISLRTCQERLKRPAMPASPYRRLDSGAIGSLAAGYPLDLFSPRDPRLVDLSEYLFSQCVVNGGFFHDIIHSGINPYLTLHLAQVLMRADDRRFIDLVKSIAQIASPTGQWPEAVNPRTASGCMGDGQHIWSAAEWIMMLVNMFVRQHEDKLIFAQGIFPEWLLTNRRISIGSVQTSFGPVSLSIMPNANAVRIEWQAKWHHLPSEIEIRLPGFAPVAVDPAQNSIELSKQS